MSKVRCNNCMKEFDEEELFDDLYFKAGIKAIKRQEYLDLCNAIYL